MSKLRILWDYAAVEEDELSLIKGEFITVVDEPCDEPGWLKGYDRTGKKGIFPSNYVRAVSAPKGKKKEDPGSGSIKAAPGFGFPLDDIDKARHGGGKSEDAGSDISSEEGGEHSESGEDLNDDVNHASLENGSQSGKAHSRDDGVNLPNGWFMAEDPETGVPYYYTDDGISTWKKPTAPAAVPSMPKSPKSPGPRPTDKERFRANPVSEVNRVVGEEGGVSKARQRSNSKLSSPGDDVENNAKERKRIAELKSQLERAEMDKLEAEQARRSAEEEGKQKLCRLRAKELAASQVALELTSQLEQDAAIKVQSLARGRAARKKAATRPAAQRPSSTSTSIRKNVVSQRSFKSLNPQELDKLEGEGVTAEGLRLIERIVEERLNAGFRERDRQLDELKVTVDELRQASSLPRKNHSATPTLGPRPPHSSSSNGRLSTNFIKTENIDGTGVTRFPAVTTSHSAPPTNSGRISPGTSYETLPNVQPQSSPLPQLSQNNQEGDADTSVRGGRKNGASRGIRAGKYPTDNKVTMYQPYAYDDAKKLKDTSIPASFLSLEYVHGYNGELRAPAGSASTTNVLWLKTGELVFPASAVVVLHDFSSNKQRFLISGWGGEVTALAVHPHASTVASGQSGWEALIFIYEADSGEQDAAKVSVTQPAAEFSLGLGSKAVGALDFSPCGRLLLSMSADDSQTVQIWDWKRGTPLPGLAFGKACSSMLRASSMRFHPYLTTVQGSSDTSNEARYCIVSCGMHHVRFWALEKLQRPDKDMEKQAEASRFKGERRPRVGKQNYEWRLESGPGIFGFNPDQYQVRDATCLAFVSVSCKGLKGPCIRTLTGTTTGEILVWEQILPPSSHSPPRQNNDDIRSLENSNSSVGTDRTHNNTWGPQGRLVGTIPSVHVGGVADVTSVVGPSGPQGEEPGVLLATTGVDGSLKLWSVTFDSQELQLERLVTVEVSARGVAMGYPRSVSWDESGTTLALGTTGNAVCLVQPGEMARPSANSTSSGGKVMFMLATSGHMGPLSGISPHPTQQWFASVGADCTLRLWDTRRRRLLSAAKLNEAGSAVAFHPGGDIVAAGTKSGEVVVMRLKGGNGQGVSWEVLASKRLGPKDPKAKGTDGAVQRPRDHRQRRILGVGNSNSDIGDDNASTRGAVPPQSMEITILRFSPDGCTLAAGCRDSNIYFFAVDADGNKYRRASIARGHLRDVRYMDFSLDGNHLQSVDSSRELLYWHVQTGKQVTQVYALRDEQWATWTCPIGWPVRGAQAASGFEVECASRSSSLSVLATGGGASNSAGLSLVRYPCHEGGKATDTPPVHSCVVSAITFLSDDKRIVSCGGADGCTMQWRHHSSGAAGDTELSHLRRRSTGDPNQGEDS